MIGTTRGELLLIGREVAGFQFGARLSRGPLKIASLFAMGLLRKSPTAFSEEPLSGLSVRIGSAPLRAFALGPFDVPGPIGEGLRGLLVHATAIAATVRPSARDGLLFIVTVAGDFTMTHSSRPASFCVAGPSCRAALSGASSAWINQGRGPYRRTPTKRYPWLSSSIRPGSPRAFQQRPTPTLRKLCAESGVSYDVP